uniref:PKD domain-containing protein n=1 Tax=Candidatus Methanogaster sp. ANME-2c ERB4 TaxID=2759911 RepID=A0A7G9YF00_9EURY|nr:hypothetical protein OMIELODL_00005 [Methanosarcinales archaeon ANME-2c ERB4]QNO46584.1 hypothetical protein DLPLDLPG_00004 [Methanosarcinales archaeon ANME-2c ERB4]
MNWKTENYSKHPKRTRAISTVVIVAIILSVFTGTVPAESGSLSINADSTQNVADAINGTHENCIGDISFEVPIPQSKEKLKMPEKRGIHMLQKDGKDISFPVTNQNKNGLKVSSFIKNATGKVSVVLNAPRNASRNIETVKYITNEIDIKNCEIKEKAAGITNYRIVEESEPKFDHPITDASMKSPSSQLTITLLNERTASVGWVMHAPSEYAAYTPFEKERLEENVEGVEKGIEDLFLQDVQNITITEGNETIIITFNLVGDYANGFVTGRCRYTYELATYAPIGLNVLKVITPQNKTLLSINPGPNEIEGNELVYYDYNWICPIQIHYAEKGIYRASAATIGEVWERPTPSVISIDTFGTNNHSRFCIPGNWVGWGSDPVPGTAYIASRVAEIYKPMLYNRADQCPDTVYYRVVKGYDPYAEFDAYVIQYFGYWRCQDPLDPVASHEYDYEPIFVWVQNIGDRPYRVAYDRWEVVDWHLHDIHRTYMWSSYPNTHYDMVSNVYMQDKAYYPFGMSEYAQDVFNDIYIHNLSTSLKNNWDGNHVRLGIANRYHTYDTDISGSYCGDCSLSPLTDEQLITWYRMAMDDENPCDVCDCDWSELWSVMPFKYDISDPFYGLFWEDHYGFGKDCDFPTISAAINSAELTMVNGTLSVDTSAYYDNSRAGGSPDMNLTGLWKDRFSAYLEGEGSKISLDEPSASKEHSKGNYIIKFNNLPLGTYDLSVGVSDNINENNYWTEPENKITNEFDDDFEDTDFSLAVWSPTKGNWHINTGSNNYLWTTSPASDGYDPITQMMGTSNWTDYTVEADIAFIDPGTEGSAAHAYILGRDSIIMSEACPYGGAYIAGVGIENDGGWTGEVFVFRIYDANGDLDIPQDELVCLGRKPLPSGIVSDLANHYWCNLKVGFEGDRITAYVNSPSTSEYAVLSVIDEVNKRGDIGFGASEAGIAPIEAAFDNVRATKGCIFNDQFENILFSSGVWYVSSSTDCYVADLGGNGMLVLDDPAGTGSYAYIDQDFSTESAVVAGVFEIIEDKSGSSYTGVEVTQDRSVPHTVSYGFNAKTDDETFVIYWYDPETGAGDSVYKSYPFSRETRYNFKLVVDNDANRMHVYLNNKLELSLDLPERTGNLSSVLLCDRYATSVWDNIYVEETLEDTTPPVAAIISPCSGATVSGRVTVEVDVSDTGSGSDGTGHAALYVNDMLAAVNDSGSCNPRFKLDTATMDSGDCTLTVVAVDGSGNSNQTAAIVDINKIPVANFTYSPDSLRSMDMVTFDASASYDPDPEGHIVEYSWNFGDIGYGNRTTGTDAMITHSYATEGYYVLSLTVTDDKGAASLMSGLITVTAPRGDLNHDGMVTSADAVIVLEMAARGEWSVEADVDGDDVVTSLDALMVMGDAAKQ